MPERSTALTALTFDGSPVACQHAVLITSGEPGTTGGWSVVLLGLSRWGLEKLGTNWSFFEAAGSLGERFSGMAHVVGSPSRFYVRLEGQGPLRQLAPLRFAEKDPTEPSRPHGGRGQAAAKRRAGIGPVQTRPLGLRIVDEATLPPTSTASASGTRAKTGLGSRRHLATVEELHLVRDPHPGERDPA